MQKNTPRDLKTRAYVIRRTNYGEADRILNLITPSGKISAIAKGVRKPKSKLAGAVEMFTLLDANLHFGKSDLAVMTGARMVRFYTEIVGNYERMEVASLMLKRINRVAEQVDNPEFFEILDKCLFNIDAGSAIDLTLTWFLMNLARAAGEQLNLYTDADGKKLEENEKYNWDNVEMVFGKDDNGSFDASKIKVMRLMISVDLTVVSKIKNVEGYIPEILKIAKTL